MSTNSLYNLSWGEYGSSLISAVQLLRCQNELVDVTLAAEGRTFQAHKVVLSAASPFLLQLLKTTTCKHPIVMLAGVQASDLEAILEFVYRGEVSVDQNQLPSLLQAAQCLNIQGLAPLGSEGALPHTSVKTVLDISKSPSIEQIQALQADNSSSSSFVSQLHEEEPRRKRKPKRTMKDSIGPQIIKWPKVYVHLDNDLVAPGSSSLNDNANTWAAAAAHLHPAPSNDNFPMLVQSSSSSQSSSPKIRGASDQPGACPLCGAMLRQARNLRRHLLTSCKYRMEEANAEQQNESKKGLTPLHCSDLVPS